MKVLSLLLTIVAVLFSQASAGCVTVYTRAAPGSLGGYTFTGITNTTGGLADYNNPMYYSKSSALALGSSPDGRLVGALSLKTNVGNLNLEFFKTNSWITMVFGKGPDKVANVITGGTGCFAGYVGTATRTVIKGVTPAAFQWDFCTTPVKTCSAGAA